LGIIDSTEKTAAVKGLSVFFDINRRGIHPGMLKTHNAELKAKVSQNQRIQRKFFPNRRLAALTLRP